MTETRKQWKEIVLGWKENPTMKNEHKIIVDTLSDLIAHHLGLAANEQYHPAGGPDQSDDRIKDHLEVAREFRRIRGEFENISTRVIIR